MTEEQSIFIEQDSVFVKERVLKKKQEIEFEIGLSTDQLKSPTELLRPLLEERKSLIAQLEELEKNIPSDAPPRSAKVIRLEVPRTIVTEDEDELPPLIAPSQEPPSDSPTGWTAQQKKIAASLGLAGLAGSAYAVRTLWQKANARITQVLTQYGMNFNELSAPQRKLLRAIWMLSEWAGKMRVLRYYSNYYGVENIVTTPAMWDVIAQIYYRRPASREEIVRLKNAVHV